jgi:hypothetical protein
MNLIVGFLRTIHWRVVMKSCIVVHAVSPELADWLSEVSGLNEAVRSAHEALENSDRREAGSEPPSALPAKS